MYRNGIFPLNIYLFKSTVETEKGVNYIQNNNIDTKTVSHERSGAFIANFKHISHLFLVFLLLTLNMKMFAGWPGMV